MYHKLLREEATEITRGEIEPDFYASFILPASISLYLTRYDDKFQL